MTALAEISRAAVRHAARRQWRAPIRGPGARDLRRQGILAPSAVWPAVRLSGSDDGRPRKPRRGRSRGRDVVVDTSGLDRLDGRFDILAVQGHREAGRCRHGSRMFSSVKPSPGVPTSVGTAAAPAVIVRAGPSPLAGAAPARAALKSRPAVLRIRYRSASKRWRVMCEPRAVVVPLT